MQTFFRFSPLKAACIAGAALLIACSPKYDWRELRGQGASYLAAFPAKPASHARQIDLDGTQVTMTMTATEVDDATFAIGVVTLPDAAQANKAAQAMKTAMVRNIGGTVKQEKSLSAENTGIAIEVEASGPPGPGSGGQPRLLLGRFIAKGTHAYQLIILGNNKNVPREAAETFFSSFKAD